MEKQKTQTKVKGIIKNVQFQDIATCEDSGSEWILTFSPELSDLLRGYDSVEVAISTL